MRISIIGPSGSGKSTLAKQISRKYNIKHINLDYVFYDIKDKKRIPKPNSIWTNEIQRIIDYDSWIIEGVSILTNVLDKADLIIYLRPSVFTSIFRQWRRFILDPVQQKEHGFINNLKLSKYIIRQYLENEDKSREYDPKYVRVKKNDRILEFYSNKVRIIKNNRELSKLVRSI